jgi:short-subunit dehydrogenase
MDYTNKVVLVTGASSGIGRVTALEFARRGAIVVGVARREELLASLADQCREHAADAGYFAGDLADSAFAKRVVDETAAKHGRLDVLINNAGIPMHKQIYDVSAEEMENVMRVNFLSCAWTTLAAIPYMLRQGGGFIVNVSSFAAKVAPPRETPYTASKCAMDGFTEGLWTDLSGSGIHAALVIPGPIDTEIWAKDDTPSGYSGAKYPPQIVTRAVFEAIEKHRHEIIAPRMSLQLLAARFLRTFFPALLRFGMNRMEPVPPEVIERAKAPRPPRHEVDRSAHGA